jgi:hypothetical protein
MNVVNERRLTHRLGKRLAEGVQLRSIPPLELPWITTFNFRWWRHVEEEDTRRVKGPRGQVGTPT